MLPAPVIAALAPLVVDAVKGKAKDAGPIGEAVAGMLQGSADHERRKASVRPLMMKLTGTTSVIVAVAGVAAALSPWIAGVPQETSNDMVMNLLMLFGAVGGAYGVQHTTRSFDKAKEKV